MTVAPQPVATSSRTCGMVWQSALLLWASPATLLGLVIGILTLFTGGRGRRVGRTLEFWGGFARGFLRHAARNAGAMTLGHVILGQHREVLDFARPHELVHVRQYERWGPMFLPAYGLFGLWQRLHGRHPYWDNPFEREAFETCPDRPDA